MSGPSVFSISISSLLPAQTSDKVGKLFFRISLTAISRRPRELSSTNLSQCGSFLCLRISNPDDQAYVRNLLPDSVRGITATFSTLRRGEAILLGDPVMMPTRIRIDPPNPPRKRRCVVRQDLGE